MPTPRFDYFESPGGFWLAQTSSPFAKETDAAFTVLVPFFAPKPSTLMTSPVFTRLRPQPSRSRSLMPTSSIAQLWLAPLSSFASMKTHACGLVHSSLVTVPVNLTGRLMSNSAANEWCAEADAAVRSHATPTAPANKAFIPKLLKILDHPACSDRHWMRLRLRSSVAPNFGRSA